MARTIQLACARCGHSEMYVVESTESDETNAEIVRASGNCTVATDDAAISAAMRLRRLESLPTSLPVGGIITPV